MEFKEDPKFSFIVPVYKVPPSVLKRCLLSIADQDYPNIETVIVFDGKDDELRPIVDSVATGKDNWKVMEIEHAGACAARNAGFRESTGEIVSFFNSDYVATIGMVRRWVDELQAHPEHGFAYGPYEYSTADQNVYPSKPFNLFQLEVANYIDCGFPLWRKYVVEWDPAVKSLQDWDFWLRVVKTHNVTGSLLKDVSFVAEPPRDNGLSDDSHHNWIERVKFIKNKMGIPQPEIVVTSLGAANHGVEIAKTLGADFRDDTIFKPNEYKALYMIGFYTNYPTEAGGAHAQILKAYSKSVKKIVHWVGADIYKLRKFSWENLQYLIGALNLSVDVMLCENEQAQAELKAFGIDAEIVPIPPYSDYRVTPLPQKFRVATLLTDKSDFDKYLKEHTLSIIRAMPDVEFASYGDGDKDVEIPNLKRYGEMPRKEWEQFVKDNSCLLRIARHDTRPMASDEFIMAGRSVVTNIPDSPFFYMNCVDTAGKVELNNWDRFGSGFNAYNWPETKSKLVQEIRKVRAWQATADFEASRHPIATSFRNVLDREKYREKIYSLAGIERKGVLHVA